MTNIDGEHDQMQFFNLKILTFSIMQEAPRCSQWGSMNQTWWIQLTFKLDFIFIF